MRFRALFNAIFVSLLIVVCLPAHASNLSRSITAHGLTVHYGIVPVRKAAAPGQMIASNNSATSPDAYRLTVAIFDAKTGRRLSNATVLATVKGPRSQEAQLHANPVTKHLEPTNIGGVVTYGNDFAMRWNGVYHVELLVARSEGAKQVTIPFNYEHRA